MLLTIYYPNAGRGSDCTCTLSNPNENYLFILLLPSLSICRVKINICLSADRITERFSVLRLHFKCIWRNTDNLFVPISTSGALFLPEPYNQFFMPWRIHWLALLKKIRRTQSQHQAQDRWCRIWKVHYKTRRQTRDFAPSSLRGLMVLAPLDHASVSIWRQSQHSGWWLKTYFCRTRFQSMLPFYSISGMEYFTVFPTMRIFLLTNCDRKWKHSSTDGDSSQAIEMQCPVHRAKADAICTKVRSPIFQSSVSGPRRL